MVATILVSKSMKVTHSDLSISVTFLVSFMVSQVESWLMNNDNSETVYFLQKEKEDPNSFCCHFKHPTMPF